jgi:hypothetical protein
MEFPSGPQAGKRKLRRINVKYGAKLGRKALHGKVQRFLPTGKSVSSQWLTAGNAAPASQSGLSPATRARISSAPA